MVKEIQLTQGKVALVDDEDYNWLIKYKWCANKVETRWYAIAHIPHKGTIRMHQFLLNPEKGMKCDNINGNGLDNRRCNLRIVTNAQNSMNKRKKRGMSKYKGVHWRNDVKEWRA